MLPAVVASCSYTGFIDCDSPFRSVSRGRSHSKEEAWEGEVFQKQEESGKRASSWIPLNQPLS